MAHVLVPGDRAMSRDAIDDAIGAASLTLTNIVKESATHPRQLVATTRDGGTFVTFVTDAPLGLVYAIVEGREADALARCLSDELEAVRGADLEARAAEGGPGLVWALTRAAALRDVARAEPLALAALSDESAAVRRAAALACAYVASPALVAAATERLATEPDAQVRGLLEACKARGAS
ncbi:MAG: hypothetical protein U0271_25875 [Polyangiaceae bacterium]